MTSALPVPHEETVRRRSAGVSPSFATAERPPIGSVGPIALPAAPDETPRFTPER